MRDPFMFVENDVAYLIGTTDEQAWGGKAFGFLGYKSNDLTNFEGPFVLFKNNDEFWADEQFWAPEMHKINGKYCIFATFFKNGKHRASQVLTCDTPFGEYKPLSKPFTPEDWDCLDATYYEENGHKYAIFCHEWLQVHDGEICCGELDETLTSLKNIKTLFKGSDAKWTRSFKCGEYDKNYVTDGPFIYKTKENRLLMLWSSVTDNEDYALGIAYSDNGIMGDWKQFDEPLFKKDGGHGMVFNFKNRKYLILHTSNKERLSERPKLFELTEENKYLNLKER